MSVSQLSRSLLEMNRLLSEYASPWALVGGLAVSTRCEPRFTHDLDLAISVRDDEQAESLTFKLIKGGATLLFTLDQDERERLSMVSLSFPQLGATAVDLLFASSGIEDEIIAQAELIEVFPQVKVPVATAAHLTALKLLSVSLERMKDLSDLSALREIMSESERLNAQEAYRLITKRHRPSPRSPLAIVSVPREHTVTITDVIICPIAIICL